MKTKLLLLVSLCAISLGAWKIQAGNPETTIITSTDNIGIIIITN